MKDIQLPPVVKIQVWLAHLIHDSAADFAEKKNPADRSPQTGQAWRSLPDRFGPVTGPACTIILSDLYDFGNSGHPLATLVADPMNALGLELQTGASGKFKTNDAPQTSDPLPTLRRFCDWLDAAIHFSTHSYWHHARFCFDPDPEKRDLAAMGLTLRYFAHQSDYTKAVWRHMHSVWAEQFKDSPKWLTLGEAMVATEPEPWTYQQIDTAIIYVWPLVRRHNWTYRDLLNIVAPLLVRPNAYPCQSEQELAATSPTSSASAKPGAASPPKTGIPQAAPSCPSCSCQTRCISQHKPIRSFSSPYPCNGKLTQMRIEAEVQSTE